MVSGCVPTSQGKYFIWILPDGANDLRITPDRVKEGSAFEGIVNSAFTRYLSSLRILGFHDLFRFFKKKTPKPEDTALNRRDMAWKHAE
jgi:hypothetical protein